MDISCWKMRGAYWLTYCLHCGKETLLYANNRDLVRYEIWETSTKLTISAIPGPRRSHWLSICSIMELMKVEFFLAASWVSVMNLMQSSHTWLSFCRNTLISCNDPYTTISPQTTDWGERADLGAGLLLLIDVLLRVKELRDVQEQRTNSLGQIHFRNLIGHELSFGKNLLLGYTQAKSAT